MIEIFGIEMTILELIGIISVIIITPAGYWNMIRMRRKKQQEILLGGEPLKEEINTQNISPEVEQQAKLYIEQYKLNYSKESLIQGLLGLNLTHEQSKELVDKYY